MRRDHVFSLGPLAEPWPERAKRQEREESRSSFGARSRGNHNRAADRHINNGTAALRDGRYLKQQYARRHVDVEIGDKTTPTAEYGSGQDHRR